jgi:hypothetical protein
MDHLHAYDTMDMVFHIILQLEGTIVEEIRLTPTSKDHQGLVHAC